MSSFPRNCNAEEKANDAREKWGHAHRHGYLAWLVNVEGPVVLDVPSPVDCSGDGAEEQAGRPEQTHYAQYSQYAPDVVLTASTLSCRIP